MSPITPPTIGPATIIIILGFIPEGFPGPSADYSSPRLKRTPHESLLPKYYLRCSRETRAGSTGPAPVSQL